jgi:predicted DNA-binding transcriptional regulator YafY
MSLDDLVKSQGEYMSQTERVFYIMEKLKDINSVNTPDTASLFEVSSRTIKRDIEYIRDRLGFDLLWENREKHYFLGKEDLRRIRQKGEGELMFYALAMGFCRNSRLMPLVSQSIEEHLTQILPADYRRLTHHISYDLFDYPEPRANFFSLLLKAIAQSRMMEMVYISKNGSRSDRRIDPLHLKNWNGQWYLAAWCHYRQGIRLFLLSRIQELVLLDDEFVPSLNPQELNRRLNSSFGIMADLNNSEGRRVVKIRFTGNAARLIRGVIWHPSQVVESRGEESFFSFPVASYEEVLNLVFSYREEAEVLEPADLRDLWLENIRKMAKNYL